MMTRWGIVIGLGGLALIITAMFLPSTISNETMIDLPYSGASIGSGRYTETYNLVRAQVREMVLHGGLALMLAGVMLFVGGQIEQALRDGALASRPSPPVDAQVAPEPAMAVTNAAEQKPISSTGDYLFGTAIGITVILIGLVGLAIAYGGKG